jgi:recombination protein RecT
MMTTELAKQDKHTQIAGFDFSWETIKSEIMQRIPDLVDRDKIAEQAFFLVRANPALLDCTPDSFVAALVKARALQLDPCLPNQLWLIPRKMGCKCNRRKGCPNCGGDGFVWTVTTQMGYGGMRVLALRSGSYADVFAHAVFENDDFDVELISGDIHHRPCWKGKRGELVAAYSVAIGKDGRVDPEIMSLDQLHKIRNRSDAWKRGQSGPWKTDPAEMCRKTVLKRHCKRLEMSADARRELRAEDVIDVEPEPTQSVDVAALPNVTAAPSPALEAPPEPAHVPLEKCGIGVGQSIANGCKQRGIHTPEQLWDAIQRGDAPPRIQKKTISILEERFGVAETAPEAEVPEPDAFVVELAERLANRPEGFEPMNFVAEMLVQDGHIADQDEAMKRFGEACKADGRPGYTRCSLEQHAEAWAHVVNNQ